ncbi:hypothetical protein HanXRQr2_Chr04g0153951 [Helianthus annuus]|uniref:Uncharacterized protein n=1 Tax=Helianthus annuus TaxID=4232 RepID=A0A9K3J5K2_HELAN|nr:hypothetical protein HanXRQr2_Chr04g0153951 [Helianthus annuus]KAJ0930341.1 hypothetical protein HanPSC8_Chr04g0148201 [Helianthus annuus]
MPFPCGEEARCQWHDKLAELQNKRCSRISFFFVRLSHREYKNVMRYFHCPFLTVSVAIDFGRNLLGLGRTILKLIESETNTNPY